MLLCKNSLSMKFDNFIPVKCFILSPCILATLCIYFMLPKADNFDNISGDTLATEKINRCPHNALGQVSVPLRIKLHSFFFAQKTHHFYAKNTSRSPDHYCRLPSRFVDDVS